MGIYCAFLSFGVLALLPGFVWPADGASAAKVPPGRVVSATAVKNSPPTPSRDPEEIPALFDPFTDPFGAFLRKIRQSEDSLHYLLGERTFERQRFDSALSHHLAVRLPAPGPFRDTLLAQRSRIFARVWPAAVPLTVKEGDAAKGVYSRDRLSMDSLSGTPKPEFAWGMGTSHSRSRFRTGFWQPDGWKGVDFEERYWMYNTYARQSWPLSIRSNALILAANVDQSTAGGFSTFDAALEAHVQEGILADLAVMVSGGRRRSLEWGAYQSYDLLASKAWYFESVGMGLQAGFSREWSAEGQRMNDNGWVALRRDIMLESGNTLGISLNGAFEGQDPYYDRITTSVLYVDDVSKERPTHFRTQDFRDTLHGHAGDALGQFARHAGAFQLAMVTPRSYLSLSPALQYGFSLPAGFGAMAGVSYALDSYRESAWDWVPTPDSMDLANAGLVGLAFNRADGRYYAAALVEEDGVLRESYGALPLQNRKAKRLDQRVGFTLDVWRSLPHGYTLALESSAGFGWTNMAVASPIGSQPWQWSLSFHLSRSSNW
jgi:hypothetical protein